MLYFSAPVCGTQYRPMEIAMNKNQTISLRNSIQFIVATATLFNI